MSAARAVSVPHPLGVARWGTQIDAQVLDRSAGRRAQQVAGYVAKYATKSSDGGDALDAPIRSEEDPARRSLPPHLRRMAETAWALGGDGEFEPYRLLAGGELFGLRAKRVDPLRRTVTIAETVVDVGGHPYFGPPKTRAGRRTIPLPRVAADPLAEHLRTYDRQPDDLVFTAPEGGPVQLNVWRQRFWAPAVRDPCTPPSARSAAHRGGAVDGRRRQPQGGGGTGGTHVGELARSNASTTRSTRWPRARARRLRSRATPTTRRMRARKNDFVRARMAVIFAGPRVLRPRSFADRDRRYLRNHVMPTFGRYELGRINHPMVAAWVAELAQRRAPATVHKAHQIMAKIIRSAVDAGLLANSPCDRVPLPKVEHTEMRFLAPDEIGDLADAIGDEWRALVLVGCYGGLRIGELHGLRVPRVDLLRAQVDVAEIVTDVAGHLYTGPPKTRAGRRTVQLPRFVIDELDAHLGNRSEGLVWPNEKGDHLRVTSWRRRAWAPAVAAAGLAPLRCHDMRHTAVALWIAAGASPTEIARRAGHRSVVTVLDRYGHLLPGVESRVTDALDEMGRRAAVRPTASVTQIAG